MKKKALLMVTILAAGTLLYGCGDKKGDASKTTAAVTTEAAATTEKATEEKKEETTEKASEETTEKKTEATEETTTEAATEEALDENAPSVEQARELMNKLNELDLIGAGALSHYSVPGEEREVNGYPYIKIGPDSGFTCVSDISNYFYSYMTYGFIKQRYSGLFDTDQPMFMDIDGGLYMIDGARGGGFGFTEGSPDIVKVGDNQYDIVASYDNFGVLDFMTIHAVCEEGHWRIDGFEIDN